MELKCQLVTPAIVHCFGIFCRKFLPLYYLWFTADKSCGFIRNETIAKPLAVMRKMNKSIILILIILTFGCGTKNINQNQIYIQDNKQYGELENGIPENDTLIELKNKKGTIIGIGKMAVSDNNISNLKFNLWKEFDSHGILIAEGNYKISSFI